MDRTEQIQLVRKKSLMIGDSLQVFPSLTSHLLSDDVEVDNDANCFT